MNAAIESETGLEELNQMIDGAARLANKEQALKAVQWRFRGPNGEFVGLRGIKCAFVPESQASVFDGRDNAAHKLQFWQTILQAPLSIEILPQVK
jgi:hypothetical protein